MARTEARQEVQLPPDGELDRLDPMLPDYDGACVANVVPALLSHLDADSSNDLPGFVPDVLASARQIVLLVLDGLGFEQLRRFAGYAPNLSSMAGGQITSVVPTTTATVLTSIVKGSAPAFHGILGYRMAAESEVLNVLKWSTSSGDARSTIPPKTFARGHAFEGRSVPAVSRAEFSGTGFTDAHLAGARLIGWRVASSIPVEVGRLVGAGEPFVYAYYDGIDKIAHDTGLGEHYLAELAATDRLVGDILSVLPRDCALVVTADHGEVVVPDAALAIGDDILADVEMLSGEGRFRWLHVRPGAEDFVLSACRERFGAVSWVKSRDEIVAEGWYGGPLSAEFARRVGDVALVAREPVAFLDPFDTGELRLVARHGSLTPAEMLVPLLAYVA